MLNYIGLFISVFMIKVCIELDKDITGVFFVLSALCFISSLYLKCLKETLYENKKDRKQE